MSGGRKRPKASLPVVVEVPIGRRQPALRFTRETFQILCSWCGWESPDVATKSDEVVDRLWDRHLGKCSGRSWLRVPIPAALDSRSWVG